MKIMHVSTKPGDELNKRWIGVQVSSMVNEAIETNSNFFKKRLGWEKTQNNRFPPPSDKVFVHKKLSPVLFNIHFFLFR